MAVTEEWHTPLEPELLFWILGVMPITAYLMVAESNIFNAVYRTTMAEIVVDVEIRAPPGTVWGIISDVDNEPAYWKGTKSVRNISKHENTIHREITIAFRDQKCMQDVTLYPEERVEAVFTDGIIKGTKTVSMEPCSGGDGDGGSVLLRTVWDVKMTGMMGMFTGMLKGHIRNGTEMAMQSIKEAAEKSA